MLLLPFLLMTSQTASAAPGAHGPNGEHLDGAAAPSNASGLVRMPDGSVQVPKLTQRRMGIRTVLAPEGQHSQTLTLNGRVTIDPRTGGRVQATVAGRVEAPPQGLPLPGQAVKKGQVLVLLRPTLDTAERGGQQGQLAQLRASLKLAEQRVARLVQLEGTVPRKDIEAAQADLQSLRDQSRVLGQTLGGQEAIVSPVSGVIASSNLLAGQVVEPGALLFEVVDPTRVMVEADTVDASLASGVASATLAGHPDIKLQFVGAARSLRNGSLPLSFSASTPGMALAIGQPVTVLVALKDKIAGVAVPLQSLVRNPANEQIVWIKSGAERFIPQPVQVQQLDAGTAVVTKGLAADNRVVVQGSALINQIR
ncbi:MAG: HlyD family efflux transporter periplasmic adaptor subunit [Rubrivivax sp.]|nr:MAG: HlyD family efflux transporter periplasmic adaptor subunit [Rubrivivax sp.]